MLRDRIRGGLLAAGIAARLAERDMHDVADYLSCLD
jgi:hypothetical protein